MENGLLLTMGIIIATMLPVLAQPGDPGGDPGGGSPVPLGATEILLTAGGLLGIKKMMKRKIKQHKVV